MDDDLGEHLQRVRGMVGAEIFARLGPDFLAKVSMVQGALVDHRGRVYRGFYAARRRSDGPGWRVYGTCLPGIGYACYGGAVTALIAEPQGGPIRRWPGWNIRIRAGWRARRDAQAVADTLNRLFPADAGATELERLLGDLERRRIERQEQRDTESRAAWHARRAEQGRYAG
jgi:hypothetical protein